MTLRLRPEAEADIEAIALYIAEDNPSAALRWYDEINAQCQRIADMPGMGVARPEVRAGLRTFPAGNYLILYRQIEDGAEIVRVIHGARQWQELLKPDDPLRELTYCRPQGANPADHDNRS